MSYRFLSRGSCRSATTIWLCCPIIALTVFGWRAAPALADPDVAKFVTVVEGLGSAAITAAHDVAAASVDVTTSIGTDKKRKREKTTEKRSKRKQIAKPPAEPPSASVALPPPPVGTQLGTAAQPPSQLATKPAISVPAVEAVRKLPASWPKTVDEAKAEATASTLPPSTWTEAEVTQAKDRCSIILKRINAVAIAQPPIKEGSCGAPAPIQLVSIGQNPEVAISPPATMTCELAEALSTWLDADLQPLAKKHFGSDIIKIENMSDYACRNAYGRVGNKLSEHGVANALDIRGFVTAAGKTAYVLEHWGTPQREILARIAAEKAAAEKALASKLAADKAAQETQRALGTKTAAARKSATEQSDPAPPITTGSTVGTAAVGGATSTVTNGKSKLTITLPGGKADPPGGKANAEPMFGLSEPNKLGGPKAVIKLELVKPTAEPTAEKRRAFLHDAQEAACKIFGTTLGPEANAAHRNHFHVDMAPRKHKKICD